MPRRTVTSRTLSRPLVSRGVSLVCIALLVAGFVAGAAGASHISGIRITQTGVTNLTVDVDVTVFYDPSSTTSNAYLGTYYNSNPAIDWGDGSTVPRYGYGPSTGIPLVATSTVVNGVTARAFRGSFSHTYGSEGVYTVTANTRCCPVTTPTYPMVTGEIMVDTVATTGVFGPTTFTTTVVRNTLEVDLTSSDSDDDGVLDGADLCPDTVIPEGVPTMSLGVNRYALVDGDTTFDTTAPNGNGNGPGDIFTVADTGGCSCEQIIEAQGLGQGHVKFGCSLGAMRNWVDSISSSADLPPTFTSEFSPSEIFEGQESTLIFTIENLFSSQPATGLSFTNTLPQGMRVSESTNAVSSTCGTGVLTADPGSNWIAFVDGQVAAGSSCAISVDVVVTETGTGSFDNQPSALSSSLGNSPAEEAESTLSLRGPLLAIPTMSSVGATLLAVCIGLMALMLMRRRQF